MAILIYLVAIVAANLFVSAFGPSAVIINAFLLIGLDLSLRDRLHDRWQGKGIVLKMGALILTGGLITLLLGAGRIGAASSVSFMLAAIADAVAYGAIGGSWLKRSNGSNIVGATVDSIVFPTLAFGAFMPVVIIGQIAAKVCGGFLWSLLLRKKKVVATASLLLLMATPSLGQSLNVSVLHDVNRNTPIVGMSYSKPLPHKLFLVGFAEAWKNNSYGYPSGKWSFFSKHWLSRGVTKRLSITMGVEVLYNRAGVDFSFPERMSFNPGDPKVYVTPKFGATYRIK